VAVFDGLGWAAQGQVETVGDGCVTLTLAEPAPGVGADRAEVLWLQGVPKGDKLELVVRQATELGVVALRPVYTRRSVPRPRDPEALTQRLQRVAEEAARQCGRADLPEVLPALPLGPALEALPEAVRARFLAWEEATLGLREAEHLAPPGRCAVLAGPEGGFDRDEAQWAQARGFHPVRLGPRILRAETVAPVVLGALSLLRGDLAAGGF
jgi:16S rRNA (uracil1498-N3)-methyltransferase